jgi:hypothetical protein
MHVEDEALALRIPPDLLEPVARAGADGVRRDPDAGARGAQLLHLVEICGGRRLAEALEPAPRVGGEEEDELDAGRRGRLDGRLRLVQTDVVELADGGVARRKHLAVRLFVRRANALGGQAVR